MLLRGLEKLNKKVSPVGEKSHKVGNFVSNAKDICKATKDKKTGKITYVNQSYRNKLGRYVEHEKLMTKHRKRRN